MPFSMVINIAGVHLLWSKHVNNKKPSPIPPAPAQVTAPLLSPEEEAAIPEALTAGVLRIRKAQVDDVNPGLINQG